MTKQTFKKLISLFIILAILANVTIPIFYSSPVLAEAPPPPAPTATPHSPNLNGTAGDLSAQALPTPAPDDLPHQAEAARARHSMETTLAKYREYYGPRLSMELTDLEVEGDWAHAIAAVEDRADTTTLPSELHLLAKRLPDGAWQALLPDGDEVYRQWLANAPEKLIPAQEKAQLQQQADIIAAQRPVPATPAVPPPVPGEVNSPSIFSQAGPTPTPMPVFGWVDSLTDTVTTSAVSYTVYLPLVISQQKSATGCSDESLQQSLFSLDGIELSLCTSFLSSPDFIVSAPDNAIQVATAVEQKAIFKEFSITAIPFGTKPATEDLPVASNKNVGPYRIALRDYREEQGGNPQKGSIANLFGKQVFSLVSVVNLNIDGPVAKPVIITEWVIEAGSRIWIIRASQELTSAVTSQSQMFSLTSSLDSIDLNATDLSRPSTSLAAINDLFPRASNTFDNNFAQISIASNLPFPSWWDGDCNVNNHPGSYPLGGVYRNVKACGPLGTTREVDFEVGVPQYEWQCPELSKRFMYLAYGIAPYSASGKQVVWNYSGDQLEKISNNTPGKVPQPDDVLSYGPTSTYGHTSVVVASSVDSNGNGTIKVIEQNLSLDGYSTLPVISWDVKGNAGAVSGWLHNPDSGTTCPTSGGVILYKHANYNCGGEGEGSGYVIRAGTGWQNVPSGFNDQASSLRIPSGWSIKLYEHSDRNGASVCRNGSDGDFAGDYFDGGSVSLNDRVSSFEVFDNTTCGSNPPPPATGDWEAKYVEGNNCWYNSDCTDLNNPKYTEPILGPTLDKNWGTNSPGGGVSPDNWVGNFEATINFPTGNYVFYLEHDDGAKLWVEGLGGGHPIQERGNPGSGPVCNGQGGYTLSGDKKVRVLLREDGGDAKVKLTWSTDTSVCIPPAPDTPTLQSPPNGATFNEGQSVTLVWSDTGDEYYGEVWGAPSPIVFNWQSDNSKTYASLPAGYAYTWKVKARNGGGESGFSSNGNFTVKPAAPSNLSAQAASCEQVNLTWNDNSGSEDGYKIYRNGAYLDQVGANVTSYQDPGLSGDTGYSYYVRAYKGSIESDASNTVNITTPSCVPALPDLRPYTRAGYAYPVVPSSVTGTHTPNTLYAGQPTYFDWYFINSGTAVAPGTFYVDLWIDSTRYIHYPEPNFTPGQYGGFDDWMEIINTPGWYTVRLVVDPDNTVAESDETNNTWEHQFYWSPTAPYSDDMENDVNGWMATGLWHQVDENTSPYAESHSWSHSWWYGQDGTGDYDTGAANSGDLTSPIVYIPSTGYYLRFWYAYETESMWTSWDQRWVQISMDGGPFENVLQLYDDPMFGWLQSQVIDLSGYAGHTIQVRFHFDTIDAGYNAYRGWYIDDFSITTTPPPTCADSYEPNDTPAQATTLTYGQTRSADICPGGDYDFYQFTGATGDQVVVDIDAMANGSQLDSYIFLLDSDGSTVLSANDDEILGEVRDSQLGYQLPHDGTYYIKVRAWDHPSAGDSNHFYTINLSTDTTNPTSAQITLPASNGWLDPITQTITALASDNESGINRVEFLWHDADWENSEWTWLGADYDSRDGWSWDFDTSGLADQQGGAFYIWAFDWAGNWIGAGAWNLGIDRTPPTVSVSADPMYGDAPFLDFHLWWSGMDNLSGTASYDIQYRDGAAGTWTDLLTNTTNTYTRFVGQDGHTYYFRARARDVVGNQSIYASGDGDAQYTVQISPVAPDSYETDNSKIAATTVLTDGTWQAHNFHTDGDQDWLKFTATAGVTYTLVTTNTGSHADTIIYLYDSDGTTLIASNDDDPNNWPASRLEWGATSEGIYYVRIEHWDPYAYGSTTAYGVSIAETGSFEVAKKVFLPIVLKK